MALEASHIRFAIDIKDFFDVANEPAYLAGSIYPDSRYVSEVDRHLTHPKDYLENKLFKQDDFHKGWASHLLCDDIQYKTMQELFPEVGKDDLQDDWIKRTALKVLQDMSDAKKFDIRTYVSLLAIPSNPNGEDIQKVEAYYMFFKEMYANIDTLTFDSYTNIWTEWSVNQEIADELTQQIKEFAGDTSIAERVEGLYDIILQKAKVVLL